MESRLVGSDLPAWHRFWTNNGQTGGEALDCKWACAKLVFTAPKLDACLG